MVETFTFRGKDYKYRYPNPGERTIEVPICWRAVQRFDSSDVLEVGNVLRHYCYAGGDWHTVVDKYEQAEYVHNVDIVDYCPSERYKFIICISTLEHIGLEMPETRDPQKPLRALQRMREMLGSGGQLWVTIPLGYYLDSMIASGEIKFKETYFMKRLQSVEPPYRAEENIWREASWDEVKDSKYIVGPGAWGLLIGVDYAN